ncbi:MAG TPA: hypothetical protein VF704_09035 [Allosphingosinicella sp.]
MRTALWLGTSLFVYAAATSPAHAQNECGAPPPGGGTVTCEPSGNPYEDGIQYPGVIDDLTVVLEPAVRVEGGVRISSSAPGVDLVLSGPTDTFVTSDQTNPGAAAAVSSSAGTVAVFLDDVTSTQDVVRAIVATGDFSVTVSADTLTTSGALFAGGILATENNLDESLASTGTNVSVNSVTTVGDGSTAVSTRSRRSDVVVDAGTLSTLGDQSRGVFGRTTTGDIFVTSGTITTAGDESEGINVAVEVQFEGDPEPVGSIVIDTVNVTTAGDTAVGILAATPNGSVTVESQSVHTSGANSTAIVARSTPLVANDVSHDVLVTSGMVSTEGDDALGIDARTDPSAGGDVSITSGSVETEGSRATGIRASGAGDVTVTSNLVHTSGEYANGISVNPTQGGMATVISGRVETNGYASSAITGGGADMAVTSESIVTTGEVSLGIFVSAFSGDLTVESGSVETSGGYSGAIRVFGTANTRIESQAVSTAGPNAMGIFASAEGAITVTSKSVSTEGDGSRGIVMRSTEGGDIAISNTGTVTTRGDLSRAIDANSAGGNIAIDSATVATSGANSDGILAVGGDSISITSSSIATLGQRSAGIYADASVDGDIVITSGSVTTAGDTNNADPFGNYGNAHAIEARAQNGSITIDSTNVETRGTNAVGILATTDTGAINITSGAVTTAGEGATGIYAATAVLPPEPPAPPAAQGPAAVPAAAPVATPPGISITSTSVVTAGEDAVGIRAITEEGDIFIESGAVQASGDYSQGVYASSSSGDVTISSDSVTTAGVVGDNSGLLVRAFEGSVVIDSVSVTTTGGGSGINARSGDTLQITSGSVVTQGDRSRGISTGSYNGDVIVTSTGTVSTAGDLADGIVARGLGGIEGAVTVTSNAVITGGDDSSAILLYGEGDFVVTSTRVETAGIGSPGIDADVANGDISITSGSVTTTGDDSPGIEAASVEGDVTVASTGTVSTAGSNAAAILLRTGEDLDTTYDGTGTGTIVVTSNIASTAGDNSDGISAFASAVSITSTTVTTAGDGSRGIAAIAFRDSAGDVSVVSGAVTTAGDSSNAIHAYSAGTGDVVVQSTSVNTAGPRSRGIFAAATGGDVTVTSGSVVTAGATISEGILAQSNVGDVTVTSGTVQIGGGTAPNTTNRAIVALSRGPGDVTVDSGTVETHGINAPAINAISATGDVSVASDAITTDGGSSQGIQAQAGFEAETGSVTIVSGSVSTAGGGSRAIFASAAQEATVTSGTVTTAGANSPGIVAFGANVSVTSTSVTTNGANSTGIFALSRGLPDGDDGGDALAARVIGSDQLEALGPDGGTSVVSGSVATSGADSVGIEATAEVGDVEVTSTGTLTTSGGNSDGIVATAEDGLVLVDANAISVSGPGSDAIVIAGGGDSGAIVRGLVEAADGFAIQADGAAVAVSTTASGNVRGRIDLTDGADSFANAGTFEAIGTSAFGGGSDVLNNTGTVRVESGHVVLGGLEQFDNAGLIDMADGAPNDGLTVGGFIGQAGSVVAIDVDFAAGTADVLTTGAATGSTLIQVAGSGAGGTLGFTDGILVVDAATGTSASAFTLAGQSIDNGFVTSGLIFQASGFDFLLINTPKEPVFETSQVGEMTTNVWQQSADAVFAQIESASDRPEDLRPRSRNGLGVWAQLWTGEEERGGSQSFTLGAATTDFDVSFEQEHDGIQGGLDYQGGALLAGVTFGIGSADARFRTSGNGVGIDVRNFGGYVGFDSGIFHATALVKYDWMDVTSNAGPGLAAEFDAHAWGAELDAGARFEFGRLFAEPSVGISWVSGDVADYAVAGADIRFEDAESLRGYAGLRLGGVWDTGDGTFAPFVGARLIDEFDGENRNSFVLGETLGFVDEAPGAHGELSAGLSVFTSNVELFVRGEMLIGNGDEADGQSARAGVRIRF